MAIEEFSVTFEVDEELATPLGAPSEGTGLLVIYDNELTSFRVAGEVSKLVKGTFKGQQALLVVLKFTFLAQSGTRLFRFKSVDLKLTDFDNGSSIKYYTPSIAIGEEKDAHITWTHGLKFGVDGAGAGVPLNIEPDIARERVFDKTERMKIESQCTGRKGTGIYNQISWAITEPKTQNRGIPPLFKCAFIVQAAAGFKFNLHMDAHVGLHLQALWAALWAKPTVVSIDPAKAEASPDGKLDGIDLAAEAPLLEHF